MPDYRWLVKVLGLTAADHGPLVLFIGLMPGEKDQAALHNLYGTKHLVCGSVTLPNLDSGYSSLFVFSKDEFMLPDAKAHLWRVAKEGAKVFILGDNLFADVWTEKVVPSSYGLIDAICTAHDGIAYITGTVRRDTAEHFRR